MKSRRPDCSEPPFERLRSSEARRPGYCSEIKSHDSADRHDVANSSI